ncbi:MAG: isochorismatase family protein [Bacteroidales bacterium]|nr:isochorismatase family protein [Bacteroides sp.]MCM1197792.1 isochorismatase family protein [Clostridium sp.]MCM1501723.1 isochorismatase family protein [Bacteroidales bacterium]
MKDTALIVVDMLYDFIDGSLACQNAENAVKETVRFIDSMTKGQGGDECEILDTYPILFICDHHPADHSSFKEFGGIWPVHCVQGTRGGSIHTDLVPYVKDELTFYKGCDKECEQYSGFEGKNTAGQSLGEILELLDINEVYVCGIATEYCVRNTCEDLLKAGINVILLKDAVGYVDADGHRKALEEMSAEGIVLK